MATLETMPGRTNSKLGAVQVNVVDYKPFMDMDGIDEAEMQQIRSCTRKLIDSLRTYTTFMSPGEDKVATEIKLSNDEIGQKLHLNLLLGNKDEPFIKSLDIPVPKKYRGQSVNNLHEALAIISQLQPGGNVPNMVRNIAHAIHGKILPKDMEMLLYTTDEPVFQKWFSDLPEETRNRIDMRTMSVPSRKGLHLPYTSDLPGGIGTLGLVTPMHSTIQEMSANMGQLATCNHVLVSESYGQLVTKDNRLYREFQNPSTAFREQCALDNYSLMLHGGRIPIVSLNDLEMEKYLRSIESRRGLNSTSPSTDELAEKKSKKPSFGQPFDENRKLSSATAELTSESFNRYFSCVTPHPEPQTYFPLSVSCGPLGGYHIACTPDGSRYVIFSSTPQESGTEKMFKIIGENEDIKMETKRTMGAGDSVSSVLSLVHLWDIDKVMSQMRSSSHPIDAKFIEISGIIFTSILSRFAGEILYHSSRCDWMSIPPDKFPDIISATAKKSLDLAACIWNSVDQKPTVACEPDWEIDIAMWQL